MDPSKYLNQSILRSLQILESFTVSTPQMTIPEISRKVGLHRSTVHRFVVTLESEGWLRKIPGTEKFSLGIKLHTLGNIAGQGFSSVETVRPFLEALARKTGETVILSMFDSGAAVCVDKIESSQRLKISSEIGQYFPLHAGATGFAVLLGMPEKQVREFLWREPLPSFTSKTETDPQKIFERYLLCREKGYAVSTGAVDPGVTAVASPVFFPLEKAFGSVGITMPENRTEEMPLRQRIDEVIGTARAIAEKIGFAAK